MTACVPRAWSGWLAPPQLCDATACVLCARVVRWCVRGRLVQSELLSATQEALSGNAPAFVERSIGQFAEERKLDVYGASNGIIDPPPEPVATPAGAGAGAGAGADAMPAAAAVPAAAAAAPPQPPAAGGADALPASPAPTAAGADALPAAEGEDAAPAADGAGAAPAAAAPAPAPAPANPFANLSDDDEGNLFGGDDSTLDL